MKAISTRTHGILDFVYGATFLAAPFVIKALNGKDSHKLENILLPSVGAGILAQGLATDHEFGAVKKLPMKEHLKVDLGLGALMMIGPWFLKLDTKMKASIVLMGGAAIAIALMTKTKPQYRIKGKAKNPNFLEELKK